MSSKAFAGPLDQGASTTSGRGFVGVLSLIWSAVGEARSARASFADLTAHGMSDGEAAAELFRRHYQS